MDISFYEERWYGVLIWNNSYGLNGIMLDNSCYKVQLWRGIIVENGGGHAMLHRCKLRQTN
jgi:hypothetical protein